MLAENDSCVDCSADIADMDDNTVHYCHGCDKALCHICADINALCLNCMALGGD